MNYVPQYGHHYIQGWDAGKRGFHPADCPFDEEFCELERKAWFDGWSDFNLGLTLDPKRHQAEAA